MHQSFLLVSPFFAKVVTTASPLQLTFAYQWVQQRNNIHRESWYYIWHKWGSPVHIWSSSRAEHRFQERRASVSSAATSASGSTSPSTLSPDSYFWCVLQHSWLLSDRRCYLLCLHPVFIPWNRNFKQQTHCGNKHNQHAAMLPSSPSRFPEHWITLQPS